MAAAAPFQSPFGFLPGGLPEDTQVAQGVVMHLNDHGRVDVWVLRDALTTENVDPTDRSSVELEVLAAFNLSREEFVGMFGGYADELRGAPGPQPSQNGPCPCGSGRKYKRCHGQPGAPRP